ncbi:MAG: hypothetical protein US53_C0008G0022 [Candidatus Woesebacteria bacterium GW2011_GWA1_37_7]|uniref:Uncharacterized protein n=1 Tax=Candidatus Woesebacteria bacterium GW2011_GWA1_37_7 TaxID=1618545 RepID=A0A0G0KB67_9BACT|nr:MAG: hypothetical protein US53_C0008G0022 [Candidatus Woesebacteria bacterium GW2011_GWA1_37_7]
MENINSVSPAEINNEADRQHIKTENLVSNLQKNSKAKPKFYKFITSIYFKMILTLILLLLTFSLSVIIAYQKEVRNKPKPTNFSECVLSKGSIIKESYPKVCITKDGDQFIESLPKEDRSLLESEIKLREVKASTESATVKQGCKVGGCNNEICMSELDKEVVSICIYKPEYECYKKAICEKQANGKCGWTQTGALRACFENSASKDLSAQ